MSDSVPRRRLTLIQAIANAARHARVPRGGSAGVRRALKGAAHREFFGAYFRGVAADDLAARDASGLAHAALAHLQVGTVRKDGESRIQVFNAERSTHGFDSPSTWVAIITDDMPFLVDSLGMALSARGIAVQLLIHPVLQVRRDRAGRLQAVESAAAESRSDRGLQRESWQLFEVERMFDATAMRALEASLQHSLRDVRAAVGDWLPMRSRMRDLARTLREQPPARTDAPSNAEACHLLDWMEAGHFVFLGYRRYTLRRGRASDRLLPIKRTGLGILRERPGSALAPPTILRDSMREVARSAMPVVISKANALATVHRATYLDYVAVKDFNKRGDPVAEHRFVGLWTSTAYFSSPHDIPLLRRKIDTVIAHFDLDPSSHDGKAAQAVLETWPRDELFQSSEAELIEFVRGVVNLYERRTTLLLARRDPFGRFWSCMVYVPRDRYTTDVRHRIERILLDTLGGSEIETQVQISGSNHARVHVVVRTGPDAATMLDVAETERRIAIAATNWADRLRGALAQAFEASAAAELAQRYATAFPPAYQNEVAPADALEDLEALQRLRSSVADLQLNLYRPADQTPTRLHLKIVKAGEAIAISDLLPMLENFGLRVLSERPWRIALEDVESGASVQDFAMERDAGPPLQVEQVEVRFVAGFLAAWRGEIENDGFNRLLLLTALDARQIVVLRACGRYLLQTGLPFSQTYIERVLAANAELAADLVRLFETRLDPDVPARDRDARAARLEATINRRLDEVASADEDRILRALLAVVLATLRSNFFQRNTHGTVRPTLALKLDPRHIPGLPLPRPKFEIYIYAPAVEGVHLRMGHVARGGIRWSDRREDFRTEVLGLMKAQNVKNTLIVPVGAKGGFVPRTLTAGANRDEVQRIGVAAYRQFIGALLDVTDNIDNGRVAPPDRVVRHDGDDAYLVVAADKGTATFSDIANSISVERGFWLGDAFASGGSAGYDHKKMGITARGAWECVKRHFRELGLDIQTQPFTVAGIGDMAGDVFGNGMLLSPQIHLVAAFNHQHVFLDPAPDPVASFAERERLFRLPRSSWDDYDRKRISRGGGIHRRDAKSISLSAEARQLLGVSAAEASPNDVIRAILRLQVDLLWNGGIGTYVKASPESHASVGDRNNDAVRVGGRELRARVVGEGGNLGCTQLGRIEYALAGGRINTDFIDNSAGVNTSDVEVNLKILTAPEERRGALKRKDRDRLLMSVTDAVTQLVLRNNYLQSQALSMLESQSVRRMNELQHAIRDLERSGLLNRPIEFLPDDEGIAERRARGLGLTRPELAVLLSYSKIALNQQLIESDVPEDPYLSRELERYFPTPVARRLPRAIARHRLRREIIATATTNSLVNRMGPTFVPRAMSDTGSSAGEVARAYSVAREVFDVRSRWARIEALDNQIAAPVQYDMHGETSRLLRHSTYWLLRHRRGRLGVDVAVREFAPAIAALVKALPDVLAGEDLAGWTRTLEAHRAAGVPPDLATFMASTDALDSAFDIVEVAAGKRTPIEAAARAYFRAGAALGLDWLRGEIERLSVEGTWQAVARSGLRDAALRIQRDIVLRMLGTGSGSPETRLDRWMTGRGQALTAWRRTLEDMRAAGAADFATLSVGVDAVRKLTD